jgi:tetratricopeptide (TPR) repeat protein
MRDFKVLHIMLTVAAVITASCSTQPKNNADVFTLRNHAEAGLELGNREAGRGNYESAYRTISESRKNALLTDDSSLIIRSCLSLGNVLFEMGKADEAFAQWEQAVDEAVRSNNRELLAVSRIFQARGGLLSGSVSAEAVLRLIDEEQPNIKTNRLYAAYSFQVRSLALRTLGLRYYGEAEEAAIQSLQIHEKEQHLENASYDWYTIASIRSLAGNTQGALAALQSSIAIDRRIENSWGIAASYRAMGDVYRKMGSEYTKEAQDAYARAVSIYEALENRELAAETKRRMDS